MRRVEQLITQVRRATENVRVGTTDGLSDEEFIQYMNDCQNMIQAAILRKYATVFHADKTYTSPGRTITLPSDCYGKQAVVNVWWSPDGSDGSWKRLHKARNVEDVTSRGLPWQWVLRGGTILLGPYPSTGQIKVTYNRRVRRLDKRRGTISFASFNSTTLVLSALTISPTGLFVQADYDLFSELSIVTPRGVVSMSGIPYSAVSAAGVVTFDPAGSFTAQTGESIDINSYICLGTNASTTSELPEEAEGLLLKYTSRVILDRDSSNDRATFKEDELSMLADIVDFYADPTQDLEEIPVTNDSYFDDLG